MEIKLLLDGEEKTFTVPFATGFTVRKTFEIAREYGGSNIQEEGYDAHADYIVLAFNNQFTRDELYAGYPGGDIVRKADEIMAWALNPKGKEGTDTKNTKTPTKS
ncbi:hypothetical protein D7Z54_14565 [Salibacterium salarium]|uniref:Phage protein n=1 Tax=Salibacterium salarium TaxID=284579 RepID=A0A3R9Q399_9BACI|nr:hypothetical protein [Salibacterium salarium]RSL32669.1 hypothetical protein D7Z54_14565 [Salibacterium salarium]